MGQKIDMPLFCAPTALQRLFHHDGERAPGFWSQVQQGYAKRICTSLPSSLRIA
jgi:isopentenyl diphosphate isomerase/L-lactate dehydrogenase-like FMN-dependent dehydrogenase